MSAKEIPVEDVPGIHIVKQSLEHIDHRISVVAAGDDFDQNEYHLKLAGDGRKGRADFPYDLLRDVNADTGAKGLAYTQHLRTKVTVALRKAVAEMTLSART